MASAEFRLLRKSFLRGENAGSEILNSGKSLDGSTAINFSCWIIGADEDFDEDFDEWARKVDDDSWLWRNVKERFKKVESYHPN